MQEGKQTVKVTSDTGNQRLERFLTESSSRRGAFFTLPFYQDSSAYPS